MTELHRVGRPSRGHGPKLGSVTEHLGKGYVGLDVLRRPSSFHPEDMAAARGQVAHHIAEVLLWHDDVDLHDRLEQVRLGLAHGVLYAHRAGDLEGHFARVHRVVRAVHQRDDDVDDRVAGDDSGLERLPDPLLDRGDELARDAALGDLVLENEPASGLAWPDVHLGVAELALATRLAHKASDAMGGPLDRLLVGDLRLALVGIDLNSRIRRSMMIS